MTYDDSERFASVLAILSDYYNREISESTAGVYFEGLKPYSIDAVEAGAKRLIAESVHMPMVADFVRVIDGTPAQLAERAWSQAQHLAQTAGAYRTVLFEDGVIAIAIKRVFNSWGTFCRETLTSHHAREFKTIYDYERGHCKGTRSLDGLAQAELTAGAIFEREALPPQEVAILYKDGGVGFVKRSVDPLTGRLVDTDPQRLLARAEEIVQQRLTGTVEPTPPPADFPRPDFSRLPSVEMLLGPKPAKWGTMSEREMREWTYARAAEIADQIPKVDGIDADGEPMERLLQLSALRFRQRRTLTSA